MTLTLDITIIASVPDIGQGEDDAYEEARVAALDAYPQCNYAAIFDHHSGYFRYTFRIFPSNAV